MAKLDRKLMKLFASNAGLNQRAQIGSLAANTPTFTTDIETMQSLQEYLDGWFSIVIGANSPAIEDMNSLHYLFAYQLCYLMQDGIPEWNDETEYFIGSIAKDASGNIYRSLQDNNLNNPLTDNAYWTLAGSTSVFEIDVSDSPYAVLSTQQQSTINVDTASGAVSIELPNTVGAGFKFVVKDVSMYASVNPITIIPDGAQEIEGLNANYLCESDGGAWVFQFDGTNWWIVG